MYPIKHPFIYEGEVKLTAKLFYDPEMPTDAPNGNVRNASSRQRKGKHCN